MFSSSTWLPYIQLGESYLALDHSVKSAQVDKARQTILDSRSSNEIDWTALGVTADALEKHRKDILGSISKGNADVVVNYQLTPSLTDIKELIEDDIPRWNNNSFVSRSLTVEFSGYPRLVVSTHSFSETLLPWNIECGNEKWISYSPEITKAIYPLLDRRGSFHRSVQTFVSEGLWRDSAIWDRLPKKLVGSDGLKIITTMPGFDRVSNRFSVTDFRPLPGLARTDRIFGESDIREFLVYLQSLDRQNILDFAIWAVPLKNGRTEFEWKTFLKQYDSIQSFAKRVPWLSAWKKKLPGRTIGCWLCGSTTRCGSEAEEAWTSMGLKGKPDFRFFLQAKGSEVAVLYGSSAEQRLLVGISRSPSHDPSGTWHYDRPYRSGDLVKYVVERKDAVPKGTYYSERN